MTTLQRTFSLPAGDVDYLDVLGLEWETILDGKAHWLLVHGFSVPEGYNQSKVTVALRVEAGYPDTAIDMAYFSPALSRRDNRAIGASQHQQQIAGARFQRWSRHRTAKNPWRPGVDDVSTHMALVQHWLESELDK